MKGWKSGSLRDFIELGNGRSRPFDSGTIPVFGGNGILDYCNLSNYSGETIIVGRVGAYCGSVYYTNRDVWVSDNALSVKVLNDNSAKFIYYYLKYMDLNQYAEGSSHPLLTHSLIYALPALVPEPNEQRAIASVLSSLDDKIDLLHRQNATLEGMAEALFRQWFVVEAKEEWEEKPLSGIAHFLNGLACQKYPPQNAVDRLPVLKIRELNSGSTVDADWAQSTVPKEYVVHKGDVVFSWSGSLMVKIWNGEDCILNQHLFKVTSDNYPKWFYYFWTKYHLPEFVSIAASHATTMGHIKRGDLDAAMALVPSPNELSDMSKILSPIFTKLVKNSSKIRTLEKLRDTLLPKLMSGEVRVDMA